MLLRFVRASSAAQRVGFRFKSSKAQQSKKMAEAASYPLEMEPPPSFLAERIALFDRLKAEQDAKLAAMTSDPIKVTLPDGRVMDGQSWKTTPHDIAALISKELADNAPKSTAFYGTWTGHWKVMPPLSY